MQVTLLGVGGCAAATLTAEGRAALEQAELVIGAKRLLEDLPEGVTENRLSALKSEEIDRAAADCSGKTCVLYSGDSGFYSGTRSLVPLLERRGVDFRILPGISSLQILSARLARPWQDWKLVSAHGTDCRLPAAVLGGKPTFFLTGGTLDCREICRRLTDWGLEELQVTVGERLSYPDERIVTGTAAELAEQTFAPLSVLLTEAVPQGWHCAVQGIPDDAFLRGGVPMTKQEVRSAIVSKLMVCTEDVLWDVGAGTGSVSVELALRAAGGAVYAVERSEEGCGLIRRNRVKFGAWNLRLIPGSAPDALDGLPAPDAVFVGGSGGKLREILTAAVERNPEVRLCVSAIALETLSTAMAVLADLGRVPEVTQIAVTRTKPAGKLHLMTAQNPVFLIMGDRP